METRTSQFEASTAAKAVEIYLEWKSEQKCFSFYEKSSGTNKPVPFPFNFLVIKEMNTVRGFDEKSNSGIYSNEVDSISNDPLLVKSFKGGKIAEGVWGDIKETVANAGGKYSKSLYVMTEKSIMLNVNLSGASLMAWIEFAKLAGRRLGDEWVSCHGFTEAKKGRVNYSMPDFKFNGSLSTADAAKADEFFAELKRFRLNAGKKSEREQDVVQAAEDKTEIPF